MARYMAYGAHAQQWDCHEFSAGRAAGSLCFALPGFHQEKHGAEVVLMAVAAELAGMGNAVERGRGAADPRAGQFTWSAIASQYDAFAREALAA